MTNNFFDQDFFRYLDLDLFNDYLTQKQLLPIQTPDKKADRAQVMANYLADLYVDDADSVVNDLIVVRELASDGGVMAIIELSEDQNFKQQLSECSNNTNRVLYCLAHQPDLIEPDGLKLNQTDAHQLAKKCLKDWKLINDPNSATT